MNSRLSLTDDTTFEWDSFTERIGVTIINVPR